MSGAKPKTFRELMGIDAETMAALCAIFDPLTKGHELPVFEWRTKMSELDQMGLEVEEIIEAAVAVLNQAFLELEDDGKIDAKEGVLLAAMFVDGIASRVDDPKVRFLLKGLAITIRGVARFVPGDGLEPAAQGPQNANG